MYVYIYISYIIYHISIDRWDNEPLFFCGTLARCLSGKHINFEAVEKSAVGEYSHLVLLSLRSKPILWKPESQGPMTKFLIVSIMNIST